MIGRLYTWRGAVWLLLVRAEPFVAASGMGPMRNVLLERVERGDWHMVEGAPQWPTQCWTPWHLTGERVVRPFRGLRRWRP